VGVDEDRHAWERPGAHPVAPGVHRIPLPLPGDALKAVNVYIIDNGDGLVAVDGGWAMAESTTLLEESLDGIGHRLANIREFLVTHVHRDHYTNAVAVRRITGAEVSLGEGEKATLDAIRDVDRPRDMSHLIRAGAFDLAKLLSGWHEPIDLADWEYPDTWLSDGVDLPLSERTLRVIATPGHTVGHVVFHDAAAAVLFAGDHVLPHITPSIGVEIVRAKSPLADYLASLRIVLAMPDAMLLPAHGPVTDSTHARVEALLQHHDKRLTDTADAVAHGVDTAFGVAGELGWTRRLHRLADLDTFNQLLAIQETMAHLDVLVERGWLTRTMKDGVAHYAQA
jgi:glyoxylase-like metal-dependent hydrolase (beta-lactamase superfamily II)